MDWSNPRTIHLTRLNDSANLRENMQITNIKAFPISYRVPEGENVRLGIGLAVKRDAVLIKVETSEGVTGWGESHHGRCPGAIAKLIDTTIKELVVGMDALDNVGVWDKIYRMQLASHGMGYASAMAVSGLDLALWDIKGQTLGRPLFEILGGLGMLVPRTRQLASMGLIALLIAVFPANLHVAVNQIPFMNEPVNPILLWGRLPFQLIFIYMVWWAGLKKHPWLNPTE